MERELKFQTIFNDFLINNIVEKQWGFTVISRIVIPDYSEK